MMDRPALMHRAGQALFIALLAALLLEGALRLAFGFGHPLLYAADVHTGYLPAPSQKVRRFGASIHINRFSMRSDDIDAAKPSATTRLLFIGDSVTFGTTYVDQSEIFTELIQRGLRARCPGPVEVLNASAGGWAPENEYQYLASRGTFGASIVIFVLNTNDLAQPFAPLEISPQFPISNPRTALGEVLERYVAPRLVAGIRTTDPGSLPSSEPEGRIEARVLTALSAAHSLARLNGAAFLIIFSPTDDVKLKTPAWEEAIAGLRSWADREQVPLVDLTAPYRSRSRDEVYFDGIHLRPSGHRIVAAELLKRVDGSCRSMVARSTRVSGGAS
jgi:lysophospholipase L1-like esterase